MVLIVVKAKTDVTKINPSKFSLAAGYIKIGIKASQGPKIKIVKSIHGVMFDFFLDA